MAELRSKTVTAENEPFIEKETVCTALVNGNNTIGCVVGNFAMNVAIQKAKDVGVGWVVANNSNHYGIAGMYTMQASQQGLVVHGTCHFTVILLVAGLPPVMHSVSLLGALIYEHVFSGSAHSRQGGKY